MVKKIFVLVSIMQLTSGIYRKIGNSYEDALHSNDVTIIKGVIARLAVKYDRVKNLKDEQAKRTRKQIVVLVNRALTFGAAEKISNIQADPAIISIFKQLLKDRAQIIKEQEQTIEEQENFVIIEKESKLSVTQPSHTTCNLQ